jgi:hypothetical protein
MATWLQQATRLGYGKNRIKDTPLGAVVEQAGAEFVQDSMIKTQVDQFQTQQILPINSGPTALLVQVIVCRTSDPNIGKAQSTSMSHACEVAHERAHLGLVEN